MSPSTRRSILETGRVQERLAALRTPHSPRSLLSSNSGDNTNEDGQKDPYVFHLIENTGTSARRLSPTTGEALQQMAQAPLAKSGSVPENRGQLSSGDTNTRPQKEPRGAASSLQAMERVYPLQAMERVYVTSLSLLEKEHERLSTTIPLSGHHTTRRQPRYSEKAAATMFPSTSRLRGLEPPGAYIGSRYDRAIVS
jgi:hypothetical protein